jgi:hypothetical protein
VEKVSPPQLAKSEPLPSSPSTSTNVIPNRSLSSSSTTPSNGTLSKPSQQTPILQPRAQSPSTLIRDVSPTPSSPKPIGTGVASLREQFDSFESSPSISAKTPSRAKSPLHTENLIRSTSTPSKTPTIKETSPIPITVVKSEETSTPFENIPKFYFPHGQIPTASTIDTLLNKQLRQVKEELFLPKHDKLYLEDFGKLSQV